MGYLHERIAISLTVLGETFTEMANRISEGVRKGRCRVPWHGTHMEASFPGHTRKISIPDCVEFHITTNACRGFCESWSIPSAVDTLRANPFQLITSVGQCCNIMDTEDVSELLRIGTKLRKSGVLGKFHLLAGFPRKNINSRITPFQTH